MKKLFLIIMISFSAQRLPAQAFEIEQLVLDIQKLAQLKSILTDLYKGYEILSLGYNTIKNISEGNFNLHQAFLDGLLMVSPAVKNYKKITDIIDYQGRIVTGYKSALKRFRLDRNFNPDEILYLDKVYNNLSNQSLKNLENLLNLITANKLRMSDDERLHAIDVIYADTKDKWMFLNQFNDGATVLAVQRAVENNDKGTLKAIYGLQ
jgi:hypothetical protein